MPLIALCQSVRDQVTFVVGHGCPRAAFNLQTLQYIYSSTVVYYKIFQGLSVETPWIRVGWANETTHLGHEARKSDTSCLVMLPQVSSGFAGVGFLKSYALGLKCQGEHVMELVGACSSPIDRRSFCQSGYV